MFELQRGLVFSFERPTNVKLDSAALSPSHFQISATIQRSLHVHPKAHTSLKARIAEVQNPCMLVDGGSGDSFPIA